MSSSFGLFLPFLMISGHLIWNNFCKSYAINLWHLKSYLPRFPSSLCLISGQFVSTMVDLSLFCAETLHSCVLHGSVSSPTVSCLLGAGWLVMVLCFRLRSGKTILARGSFLVREVVYSCNHSRAVWFKSLFINKCDWLELTCKRIPPYQDTVYSHKSMLATLLSSWPLGFKSLSVCSPQCGEQCPLSKAQSRVWGNVEILKLIRNLHVTVYQ